MSKPTPTELLSDILSAYAKLSAREKTMDARSVFIQSAMSLVTQGADFTITSDEPQCISLLEILVLENEQGINQGAVIQLVGINPSILNNTNQHSGTVLQKLMQSCLNRSCSFDIFKESALLLCRLGADSLTVCESKTPYSLLNIFLRENEEGRSSDAIRELVALSPTILSLETTRSTPLAFLVKNFKRKECSLDTFEHSLRLLIEFGVDVRRPIESDGPTPHYSAWDILIQNQNRNEIKSLKYYAANAIFFRLCMDTHKPNPVTPTGYSPVELTTLR
jgi:hypothetical protein